MGNIITWNEAFSDAYQSAGDYLGQAATQLGSAICDLYTSNPSSWVISPFGRGFLSNTCASAPPSPGTPPPKGFGLGFGAYEIKAKFTVQPQFNGTPFETERTIFSTVSPYVGDIANIVPVLTGQDDIMDTVVLNSANFNTAPLPPPSGARVTIGGGGAIVESTIQYEVTFIPNPTPPPPAVDSNKYTVTINNTNNSVPGSTITVFDVEIPTTNNQFEFPTSISVGGTTIFVDVDGFSVISNSETSISGGGGGGATSTREPFDPTTLTRRVPLVPGGNDTTPLDQQPELEEVDKDALDVIWLLIDITTLPHKGHTILQASSKNNEYFAGYLVFYIQVGSNKYQYAPIQIKKIRAAFKIPVEATGYLLYSVNGAKLRVTEYTQ